jgi:hypothetical protein
VNPHSVPQENQMKLRKFTLAIVIEFHIADLLSIIISYTLFANAAFGIEYYGDMVSVNQFDEGSQQNHALFIA